jgi:multidrug efflux system membrane fusion protein
MSTVQPSMSLPVPGEARRRRIGRIVSWTSIAAAIVATLTVWDVFERYPRTDDAYIRANTIGMAPRVYGQIVELPIRDNQFVRTGELLYRIDPRPYEVALAKAEAGLAVVDFQVQALADAIVVADARVATSEADVGRAEAEVRRRRADVVSARAKADYAEDYLSRVRPLLQEEFVTADRVKLAESEAEAAQAAVVAAEAGVVDAEAAVIAARASVAQSAAEAKRARNELAQVGDMNVRVAAAQAAVDDARLNLQYCEVRASVDGWVTNLNTNVGAFVEVGDTLFSLVQNSEWWVMANFLETEIEQIRVGQEVAVYVFAYPGHRFRGRVQGIGWALYQSNGATQESLPAVAPSLNWIRLAQRFPVRITLEPFDPDRPYRMGATVTAIVRTQGRDPLVSQLGLLGSPFDAPPEAFPPSGSGPTLLPESR